MSILFINLITVVPTVVDNSNFFLYLLNSNDVRYIFHPSMLRYLLFYLDDIVIRYIAIPGWLLVFSLFTKFLLHDVSCFFQVHCSFTQ